MSKGAVIAAFWANSVDPPNSIEVDENANKYSSAGCLSLETTTRKKLGAESSYCAIKNILEFSAVSISVAERNRSNKLALQVSPIGVLPTDLYFLDMQKTRA